jgi:hypothetical protein
MSVCTGIIWRKSPHYSLIRRVSGPQRQVDFVVNIKSQHHTRRPNPCQPELAHCFADLALYISYNCPEVDLNLIILNVNGSSHIEHNQHNICMLVKVLKDQDKTHP